MRQGVRVPLLLAMIEETSKRGQDAFGVVVIREGLLHNHFKTVGVPKAIDLIDFFKDLQVGDIVLWNNRARPMTEKPSTDENSIQPIIWERDGLYISHNGVVANEDQSFCIDSEIFGKRYLECGRDAKPAVEKTVGGSAYLMVDTLREKIIAIRDFKPLAKAYVKGVGYFIMSDVEGFRRILGDMDVAVWEDFYYSNLAPFSINEIETNLGMIEKRSFEPCYISSLPKKQDNKVLVMSSGGIDSSVSAAIAKKHLGLDVTLCHFDLGQKSEEGEYWAVEYLADTLDCPIRYIDLPWLGELGASPLTDPDEMVPLGGSRQNLKSTVCWSPARNLVMCSALMAVAEATGASKILNGWSLEESGVYPDNSLDFFRTMNEASNFGTLTRPRVVMLEANLMKPEIVKLASHFGLDVNRLWSCDTYSEKGECGVCGACTLKKLAIEQAITLDRSPEDILKRVNLSEV